MKSKIRKISVGQGFPNSCIHYQIGKSAGQRGFVISDILLDGEALDKFNKIIYNIYIRGEEDTVVWKSIHDVPVVVEYNVDFD